MNNVYLGIRSDCSKNKRELGKEIEKDVFLLNMSVGQRKILSPHEEFNLRLLDSQHQCSNALPAYC